MKADLIPKGIKVEYKMNRAICGLPKEQIPSGHTFESSSMFDSNADLNRRMILSLLFVNPSKSLVELASELNTTILELEQRCKDNS